MSKMMVSEEMKNAPAAPGFSSACCVLGRFLLAVTLAVFMVNALASPYFLNIWNLSDATFNFTEKAIMCAADGDADYRPGNRSVGGLHDGAQLNGDGLLRGGGYGYAAAGGMGLGVGLLCGVQRHPGDAL
jgi:rhamnose transport system permease protein